LAAVATLLADSPPAPSEEVTTGDGPIGAQPPLGDAGHTPEQPPAPAARSCARCAAPLASGQDWCLQCGAGAPGSIETPSWRSASAILLAAAILALGAVVAAYAALSQGTPKPHVVTSTVAQTPAPTTPPTPTPNPLGTTSTPTAVTALPKSTVKPPKIPLTAQTPSAAKTNTTTTPATTPGSTNTTTQPSSSGASSTEVQSEAIVLDTNAARTYNPYNYPPGDFGDPSLSIDGDTSTAWVAQVEATLAPKMAEGLLIELKSKVKLSALELITSTPGITVQVFGANTPTAPSSITDKAWVALSHSRTIKKKHAHIVLKDSTKAFTFITLWISKAPASSTPQAPGHVSVNEIELFPSK
jgi:hypothetical protein